MGSNSTIQEIKERLREEGYTSETIGEVLREVNRSFLAEDAGEVIRETRGKARQLQSVLEGIYEALIDEPVLDLRMESGVAFRVESTTDAFDLLVRGDAAGRLTVSYRSHSVHDVEPDESIRLGGLGKPTKPEAARSHVTAARITIQPAREHGSDVAGDSMDVRIAVNRKLLEDNVVRAEPAERFYDCLTFLDYVSDRYEVEAYSTLIEALATLPDRIGTYLGKKREFLRRLDFS